MSEVDGEEGPSTFRCCGGMWYREAGPYTYKCQKWMERKVHQLLCVTGGCGTGRQVHLLINVRSGWRGRSTNFYLSRGDVVQGGRSTYL